MCCYHKLTWAPHTLNVHNYCNKLQNTGIFLKAIVKQCVWYMECFHCIWTCCRHVAPNRLYIWYLPDKVTGLLEALGAETAAVGKLGFCFQFHGLVFDLADSIPLSRRLGEDPLRHRGLLAGILRQLGRLLLSESDDFQAPPLWILLLPVFILILLLFLDVLTIQTYNCKIWGLLPLCTSC